MQPLRRGSRRALRRVLSSQARRLCVQPPGRWSAGKDDLPVPWCLRSDGGLRKASQGSRCGQPLVARPDHPPSGVCRVHELRGMAGEAARVVPPLGRRQRIVTRMPGLWPAVVATHRAPAPRHLHAPRVRGPRGPHPVVRGPPRPAARGIRPLHPMAPRGACGGESAPDATPRIVPGSPFDEE